MFKRWISIVLMADFALSPVCAGDLFATDRQRLAEDNPAVFAVERGRTLWEIPAGPNNVNLERCDLGLGPGVVEGAYVALPRWFEDAHRVMDLEQRLRWCQKSLQGVVSDQAWYGTEGRETDLEALSVWVASRSLGKKLNLGDVAAPSQSLLGLGRRLFYKRAGSHDYGCVTCHAASGLRVRLQTLPNLLDPMEAGPVVASWPAYRLSQGQVRTLRWRIRDCMRQSHWPSFKEDSDALTALELFLMRQADGAEMVAPAVKR